MLCRDSEEPDCRGDVLPDAASGQRTGTLAGSWCKEAMARLPSRRQGVFAVLVQRSLRICHGSRSKMKNRDKPIYYFDRVSGCVYYGLIVTITLL
jgi:hypothetical protein